MVTLPRFVIAAAQSGAGKTTVAFGLMAAFRAAGVRVAPFKVGPDYIDPGYHSLASGRPGRNLDPWLCGPELIAPLMLHGAYAADLAIIEGVMGLLDGRLGATSVGDGSVRGFGSTAHVARLLGAPIVLVLDAAHASRTLAAVAHGLSTHPDSPGIAGVILNRTGAERAVAEVTDALAAVSLPVLGAIPRTSHLEIPSRHLGLVPAGERRAAQAVVDAAAALVAAHVDLDAVGALAALAPPVDSEPWRPEDMVRPVSGRPRIAVASGKAFTFRYSETTELLTAAGCQVVELDPLSDPTLPPGTAGLYLGGGFPEVYAEALASNASLRADVAAAVASGMPTYAECAGLLYLCRSLDGQPMVGAVPLDAVMGPRLTLGYREAIAETDSVVTRPGETVRSHEFHRTATTGGTAAAWRLGDRLEGVAGATLLASYQHVHWAGHPVMAQRFADAASTFAASGSRWSPGPVLISCPPDLHHHGLADLAPGAVDLAVNIREMRPPQWLVDALTSDPSRWAEYPDPAPAREAIAARHRVRPDQVLPTAGAAEAFALIARGLHPHRAVVVHPQFTEPEAALLRAGVAVQRVLLRDDDGFVLEPDRVPEEADLVFVGNPTNPTGVLHQAETLRALVRPGRTIVVDEAFMDFVPGEAQTVAGSPGLLVVRSVGKMWSVPGLRAGYVVADTETIARLADQQGPWPVSIPALDALLVSCSRTAVSAADQVARAIETDRDALVMGLAQAGFRTAGTPRTPFVLVDTSPAGTASVRPALARAGFAVRRCETFPGLGPSWIRIAVRTPAVNTLFLEALRGLMPAS
ncbi:MAG: cobyrinate a,c-diamide synthase [Propionibacteriaceae bacterium]